MWADPHVERARRGRLKTRASQRADGTGSLTELRGHLSGTAQRGADAANDFSAGTVARSSIASASSCVEDGSGRAIHSCSGGASGSGSGEESNSTVAMSTPETPSTSAWWVLDNSAKRSSASPSTSHNSHSGLAAVKGLREHAAGESFQLIVAPGARQRGVADVVGDVEVRIIDPHRASLVERDEGQPLAVARDEM